MAYAGLDPRQNVMAAQGPDFSQVESWLHYNFTYTTKKSASSKINQPAWGLRAGLKSNPDNYISVIFYLKNGP